MAEAPVRPSGATPGDCWNLSGGCVTNLAASSCACAMVIVMHRFAAMEGDKKVG